MTGASRRLALLFLLLTCGFGPVTAEDAEQLAWQTAPGARMPLDTELLDEAGIANARLRTPQEFADHPQLQARDRWREVDTPGRLVSTMNAPIPASVRAYTTP